MKRQTLKKKIMSQATFCLCTLNHMYHCMHIKTAQGYLGRKIFISVYLFLFIITKLFLKSESLLIFKLNQLIAPIGKKPAPGDHESSLKHLICKMSLCVSYVDLFMAYFLYCFPYSYRSLNYCDSNSCRSFTLIKALAKS